jgi:prophage regulatory protein
MTTIVSIKPLYLSREEAAKFLAISTSTFESMVAKGEYPRPRKVSPGRVGWLVEELEAWGRARPHSDLLPAPDSGYGRAGKSPAPEAASASR